MMQRKHLIMEVSVVCRKEKWQHFIHVSGLLEAQSSFAIRGSPLWPRIAKSFESI